MTQKQLAARTGISQSYISQICTGKKAPGENTLGRISECLGVPMQRLTACDRPAHIALSEEEERMIREYRALSKRDRELVCGMVGQIYRTRGRERRG